MLWPTRASRAPSTGADPREQLLFILANPLLFVQIIARDIWTNTPAYMQGWVGVYGYNYWPVPALTYLLYPVAVLLGLAREWIRRRCPTRPRELSSPPCSWSGIPAVDHLAVRGLHAGRQPAGGRRAGTLLHRDHAAALPGGVWAGARRPSAPANRTTATALASTPAEPTLPGRPG